MGWFKKKEDSPLFSVGQSVTFVSEADNKIKEGIIFSIIGGISWRHYYIDTGNQKAVLIGEPFIHNRPTNKRSK